MFDDVKCFWCGRCNYWTLHHLTDEHVIEFKADAKLMQDPTGVETAEAVQPAREEKEKEDAEKEQRCQGTRAAGGETLAASIAATEPPAGAQSTEDGQDEAKRVTFSRIILSAVDTAAASVKEAQGMSI
mmetsp:Transcript_4750/g.13426  ORF Transcript_4750/g.13426 Transcript_4750/m.13426 type:complete len:129 (-) Transcript_4750:127-513(-)